MTPRKFFVGRAVVLLVLLVIMLLVGGFFALNNYIYEQKQAYAADDYKDAEYVIDGQRVRLIDGVAETEAAPGSASKITTRFFGNEVHHDFDKDGREDVAFLLTQDTGGSGTFYYVVAALNTERGYVGSQGFLLGDRIAPQTTEMGTGDIVVVNYAERAAGEPFTTQPSVAKSVWLFLDTTAMMFGEVQKDFEGEANPATMTLGMKSWTWVKANYEDGREILPKQSLAFTIDFFEDTKEFSATTDCNRLAGSYTAKDGKISFTNIISTKMFCEGSQETEFTQLLTNTSAYHFTSRGQLILNLKFDSGSVEFR